MDTTALTAIPATGDKWAEREKVIRRHLAVFELSEEDIGRVVNRMKIYLEKYLCPPILQIDGHLLSGKGLSEKHTMEIATVFVDIGNHIRRWKDEIFFERLWLEVLIVKPGAFDAGPLPEGRN